jgi:hypothetical protein
MGKREQDTSMEQLLREALAARDRTPQSECLDAEVLAAWADGALSGSERSFAEAHAARCARCQAMLAAMARTVPAPVATPAWSIRKWMSFLTPVAAGAVALALWFLVEPRSSFEPSPQSPSPSPTAVAVVPSPTTPPASANEAQGQRAAPQEVKPEERKSERGRAKDARAPSVGGRRDQAAPGGIAEAVQVAPPNAVPASPAKPVQSPPADALTKAEPPAQPLSAPPASPPPPTMQSAASRTAQSSDQQATQQTDRLRDAARQESFGRGAGGAQFRATAAGLIIVVPGSNARWRVSAGRIIEHSLDAGVTWATQYTAPENVVLVAGAAPSSTIVWIVGRSGAVLHTSDGRTWRHIPFPHSVDLISVSAADAQTATVVAADKRSFLTSDGGTTWIERKD